MRFVTVARSTPLRGEVTVPSDKSITHRAYLFSAISEETSEVRNPLLGEDCERSLSAVKRLGCSVTRDPNGTVLIVPGPLRSSSDPIDCGNSGTTIRLLAGIVAGWGLNATLTGDESLSRRPMRRIAEPLRLMGAIVDGDTPPLRLSSGTLNGIDYTSPVASAQVKSCVLLAGLRARGETWVREPSLSRDHTERMLEGAGVKIMRGKKGIGVAAGSQPRRIDCRVPGDISSAAFWMVAAAVVAGSRVSLRSVGINPTRTGVLVALEQAGLDVKVGNERWESGEPVADIEVGSGPGIGMTLDGPLIPRLIDEIPVLAVLATQLSGETVIRDARELRVKETDRIKTVTEGLRQMGAKIEPTDDGMVIEGPTPLRGGAIDATGDHRIAMAFAVAGLVAEGETQILAADSIQTSYPGFFEDLRSLQK
ncbi:MAG: 3-phosphoshikimate 1-carboxyvinyltransferase 1 [Fimbriimonadaceae bacterium]|nr:3-phosphoshikimate 1-carboxyvinyltransferase 1 [Fimbriimonadaceae bacterium]